MKHSIKHPLDDTKAKIVLEKAFASYAERFAKYNPKLDWSSTTEADISFKAKGIAISGTAELRAGSIDLELEVPFVLSMFKKQAIEKLEEEAQRWIAKAKAGEL